MKILIVDDKPNILRLLATTLQGLGEITRADGGARALELLRSDRFQVVITDIKMPDVDGHQVLRAARTLEHPPEVIVTTAFGTLESAIDALRDGAFDYVKKPFEPDQLRTIVRRAIAKSPPSEAKLIGRSAALTSVLGVVDKMAPSDVTVLIIGESGTGKELIARAIHDRSPRRGRPFVAVNCATIPGLLMEAELFGDGRDGSAGLFENADGGTLFLDEVGEMRRAVQAKLTRPLEARAIRRVGESHERPVDVRVVAATHRDLPSLVAQEAFRDDLYYRLNTCVLELPPLRERPEDIPLLVEHFVGGRARVDDAAMDALALHRWPGNVRELKGVLERAVILAAEGTITRDDLPATVLGGPTVNAEPPVDVGALTYREALERVRAVGAVGIKRYLDSLLTRFAGNVIAAAEHADVERESFYRLCRKHGVNPEDFRS